MFSRRTNNSLAEVSIYKKVLQHCQLCHIFLLIGFSVDIAVNLTGILGFKLVRTLLKISSIADDLTTTFGSIIFLSDS